MGEEGVENRAQNTALWYASIQGEDGGVVIVNLNRLWSVGENIQGPVAETGADAKVSVFGDQLRWNHSIKNKVAF